MKRRIKLAGAIKGYLRWPLWLSLLLLIMNVSLYFVSREAGTLMTGYLLLYVLIAGILFFQKRSKIVGELIQYAADYGQVQRQLIKEMVLPYGLIDYEGNLLWGNDEFLDIIGDEKFGQKKITNCLPGVTSESFPESGMDQEVHIELDARFYKVLLRRILVEELEGTVELKNTEDASKENENTLIALYLYDETEVRASRQESQDQRMIVGLLYIDNYEEALESIDEVRRSLLVALIDRKINKYMQSMDAIIKKLEKDKYVFMFKNKYLPQMQIKKFSILEEVRTINIGNDMAVTLSIGLGINPESYLRAYDYARVAIDLALGRGGDQAVVKSHEKISYYGGKSVQVEKKTRVKARVKAHALKELMEGKERVVIMGHNMADVDSFGAAIGVFRIAKTLERKAYIVINDITSSVKPIMQRFLSNEEYGMDTFLNGQQAVELVDNNTLLVVVDVNRPNYTECPELLEMTRTIVVLDHHRQSGEAIDHAVLSYIEPYASSACEMVAEILQYVDEGLKLRQVEADAMYAGMMIDTNNFLTKTGVRTFEAAAFLKRCGADITKIRKMFRSDMQEYQIRAEAIHHASVYLEHYAFTECKAEGVLSPTIIGAQVANELMEINEIKASFVFTPYNEKIYISARSIDELNVQVVMEKLGGGGHMSVAGAQLSCSMEEAQEMVKRTLDTMNEEGDL